MRLSAVAVWLGLVLLGPAGVSQAAESQSAAAAEARADASAKASAKASANAAAQASAARAEANAARQEVQDARQQAQDARREAEAAMREAEIEKSIEQARRKLDEAARRMADLQTQLWDIETTGPRADRPMLGILLQDSPPGQGMILAGVTPEGGAEQAGLKGGDVILKVNGVAMDDADKAPLTALNEALAPILAGDSVPVTYRRDGALSEVSLVTTARGHYVSKMAEHKEGWLEGLRTLEELDDLEALKNLESVGALSNLDDFDESADVLRVPGGIRLEDIDGELAGYFGVDRGVLVLRAEDPGAGLLPGDVLLAVDGEAVENALNALQSMSGRQGTVSARVRRHDRDEAVELDMDSLNSNQAVHLMSGDRLIRIERGPGFDRHIEVLVDD